MTDYNKKITNFEFPSEPILLRYKNEKSKSISNGLMGNLRDQDVSLDSFLIPDDLYYLQTGTQIKKDYSTGIHTGRSTTLLDKKDIHTVNLNGRPYAVNIKGCGSYFEGYHGLNDEALEELNSKKVKLISIVDGKNKTKIKARLNKLLNEKDYCYWIKGNDGYHEDPMGGQSQKNAMRAFEISNWTELADNGMYKLKNTEDFYIAPVAGVIDVPEKYDKLIRRFAIKWDRFNLPHISRFSANEKIAQEIRLLPTNIRFLNFSGKDQATEPDLRYVAKKCEDPAQLEQLLSNATKAYVSLGLLTAQTARIKEDGTYEALVMDCTGALRNSVCGLDCYAFVDLEGLRWVERDQKIMPYELFQSNQREAKQIFSTIMPRIYELNGEKIPSKDELSQELYERIAKIRHPCITHSSVENGDLILGLKTLHTDITYKSRLTKNSMV